jgi:hypothetical protein
MSLRQFIHYTSHCPQVRLERVHTVSLEKLGGHIARSTLLRLLLALHHIDQFACRTQISEFEVAVFVDEDISWL